jgi:diaminopimelate epimerase
VLVVEQPLAADAVGRMRVINADGSEPEMCGNGLRCVALHLLRTRRVIPSWEGGPRHFAVETAAGVRLCTVHATATADGAGETVASDETWESRASATLSVDMGVVRTVRSVELDVPGWGPTRFEGVDAGNPHAVLFRGVSDKEFQRIGPWVATHDAFPAGTNVEFVTLRGASTPGARPTLEVRVWERGAGPTLACGTGACASAVAARARGLIAGGAEVDVLLPGGLLRIGFEDGGPVGQDAPQAPAGLVGGRVRMTGPAHFDFFGEYPLPR